MSRRAAKEEPRAEGELFSGAPRQLGYASPGEIVHGAISCPFKLANLLGTLSSEEGTCGESEAAALLKERVSALERAKG